MNIGNVWATSLAWSEWLPVGNDTCKPSLGRGWSWPDQTDDPGEARLAFSTSTGVVGFIPVRQAVSTTSDGKKYLETFGGQIRTIDQGDKRQVAALSWLDASHLPRQRDDFADDAQGVLVWTKPGSVHLWNERQARVNGSGVSTIRLDKVGNWAGCNGLGPCVGEFLHAVANVPRTDHSGINRISETSIAVVLSSLTVHIIHNVATVPTLALMAESLVATLAARQAFLDHVQGDFTSANKSQPKAADLDLLTAHTSAWAGLGLPGIATVNWE